MRKFLALALAASLLALPAIADARVLSKRTAATYAEHFGQNVCDGVDGCMYANVDRPMKDCRYASTRTVLCIVWYGFDDDSSCWAIVTVRDVGRLYASSARPHCSASGSDV